MAIAATSGTKLRDLVTIRRPPHPLPDSDVYHIPCGGCSSVYYGETGWSFNKRKTEHKSDLDYDRHHNALVAHRSKFQHQPRWIDAGVLANGLPKHKRKMLESALIRQAPVTTNTMAFSHKLAGPVAALILRECQVTVV